MKIRKKNMKLKKAIDRIFSHNNIIAIWKAGEDYDKLVWRGEAWKLPNMYYGCRYWVIFGTVPESLWEADAINIKIWR